MFGYDPVFANNVVIKDGTLGLSSHHGIHGHYNKDVTISNVHIKDFETHGVQMSYFNNLKITDVEIGPSSTTAYLKGEYAYARWTIQALERIRDDGDKYKEDEFPILFDGRDTALELDDIIDTLREQMDMAFKYVMNVETYDDSDEQWIAAKELFINEDGIPYGAVMYGLFLNLWFANVFTIHPSVKHSHDAVIENVRIHGLHHKMMEYVRMDKPQVSLFRNQFNAPLDAARVLGDQLLDGQDLVWAEAHYVGSALTDAEIALSLATDDWGEQGLLVIDSDFSGWAKGEFQWDDESAKDHPQLGCNNDRMAHVPKGVIGVRMDGVEGVSFNNLEISDLTEQSEMGSTVCGVYWDEMFQKFMGGGNTLQNAPYLYGYTGNRVHGIFSDWAQFTLDGEVKITDLECATGMVRGLGLYTHTDLTFGDESTLKIQNMNSGSELYDVDTDALPHPYGQSKAKPLHVLWTHTDDDEHEFTTSITGHPADIEISCVYGRDGALSDGASSYTGPWWKRHTVIDNSECSEFISDDMEQKLIQWGVMTDDEMDSGTDIQEMDPVVRHLVWSTVVVVAVAVLGFIVCLFEWKRMRARKQYTDSKQTEVDPLITSSSTHSQYLFDPI